MYVDINRVCTNVGWSTLNAENKWKTLQYIMLPWLTTPKRWSKHTVSTCMSLDTFVTWQLMGSPRRTQKQVTRIQTRQSIGEGTQQTIRDMYNRMSRRDPYSPEVVSREEVIASTALHRILPPNTHCRLPGSEHDTFSQSWFDVGTASQTLAQH